MALGKRVVRADEADAEVATEFPEEKANKKKRRAAEPVEEAVTPEEKPKKSAKVEATSGTKMKKTCVVEEQCQAEEVEQDAEAKTSKTTNKSAEGAAKVTLGDSISTVDEELSPEDFRKQMLISSTDGADLPDPVQSFASAPFSKKLRSALLDAGFAAPTPIQSQVWPVAVQGSDLVGVAKTGSGKTLGFLLPAFRLLSKTKPDVSAGPAVLVLAPTRELVMQIAEAAAKFGQAAGVSTVVVYGGVPKPPQAKALLKDQPQLVVATPGRLVDLQQDGAARLGNVKFLVLDEADRMLDMGFEPQMVEIMKQIPEERQTMLFSATWPKAVQKLAKNYLKTDALRVNVGETEDLAANKAVSQQFMQLGDDEKDVRLWRIINELNEDAKVIVFANTKRRIDKLQKAVGEFNWTSVAMHGDKTQWERDVGFADFVSGKAPLMFATDVCARGLDIKNVSHVINYDMARDVEGYIHRIGRTGRAGSTGASITFVNEAFDTECAPALAKIAHEAGQAVPAWLEKLGSKSKGGKANKLWKY